jgi:hypothetical protein
MPEVSQNPLWLQISNSKLHSLFENATPSVFWGGLAGQKNTVTRFGSESVVRGKFDVMFWACLDLQTFKPFQT